MQKYGESRIKYEKEYEIILGTKSK